MARGPVSASPGPDWRTCTSSSSAPSPPTPKEHSDDRRRDPHPPRTPPPRRTPPMPAVVTRPRPAPPSTARIALSRVGLELRLFSRERQQVVFSFAYPVVMLVIFSSVLGGDVMPGGVSFPQYFLAG